MIVSYLTAERELAHVAADADVDTLALTRSDNSKKRGVGTAAYPGGR